MSEYLDFDRRVACAVHLGRTELRERRQGDADAADRAHDRLYDLVADADFPNVVLARVIRGLGRHNSLAVNIDAAAIEAALRVPLDGYPKEPHEIRKLLGNFPK